MDALVAVVALVAMLAGLLGAVVPGMPGLAVVWAAAVLSLLWQDTDRVGWLLAALLTLLFLLATAATVWLPARSGRRGGVPASTLALAVLGAAVGFVLVPVVGLLLGVAGGLYLAERRRLGGHERAWASTRRIARAYGAGVLVELLVGVVMIGIWVVAVLARA